MGFDNECIINIQTLAGEYFCPVCRTLVYPNEALQSQCTHLYCKPCLTYVVSTTQACPYDGYLVTEAGSKPLTESNKALAETIGKILVHCLYHRSGCTWQGPLSECNSHCSECAFGNSPVVCNRCGIQIVHRQVQEHAQTCNVNGANPPAQQATGNVQDTTNSGSASATEQSKNATQVPASQSQISQAVGGAPTGPNPNPQAVVTAQTQAVSAPGQPTPEQWYQQQVQQYYQQYPGYDPYQQAYQQYYPYQQQPVQQFQQPPLQVQGNQSQPQPQLQPQSQPQSQPLPQSQPQMPVQAQQIPPTLGQPQSHLYPQTAVPAQNQNQVQLNPQQHVHPANQPLVQNQPQAHPSQVPLPPQSYAQGQPHPAAAQTQQMQMPQYQQPYPQMHQPHLLPALPQPHLPPQSQVPPQAQFQSHPQPNPQLMAPQPNTVQLHNAQPHGQQPSQTVTGYQSYPQPQAHQQLQMVPPPQHQTQMPTHPPQMHGQFPPPPAHMRPPQSNAFVPNQSGQLSAQAPPPAQQIHPPNQHPGLPVHHRPGMHPMHPSVPQQYAQQLQVFAGQVSGPAVSQPHQPNPYAQQQSQHRPQGPPQSVQQNSLGYVQPQHSVALAVGLQTHPSQNYAGRPLMPNLGPQQFPQPSAPFGVLPPARPPQIGVNHANAVNNQLQTPSEQVGQLGLPINAAAAERKVDQRSERTVEQQGAKSPSSKDSEKDAGGLPSDSVEIKPEPGLEAHKDGQKSAIESENNNRQDDTVTETSGMSQKTKKDGIDDTLELSNGGNLVSVRSTEEKDGGGGSLKQMEKNAENVNTQNSAEGGKRNLDGRDRFHGYQDRNSNESQITHQGYGRDMSGGFEGKNQLRPLPYGPSGDHPRPAAHLMGQTGAPSGPSSGVLLPGPPPTHLRPPGRQPEHFQTPLPTQTSAFHPDNSSGGLLGPGSKASFGREPNPFGAQSSFDSPLPAARGQYSHGNFPSSQSGPSMMSQADPRGPPPGSFESQDGLIGRAPVPRGPGGQIFPHRPFAPMETDMQRNQWPAHFDGRRPDTHLPRHLESGGPYGPAFGHEANQMRMNGAPGVDSSSDYAMRNGKFKTEGRVDNYSMDPSKHEGEFQEGKKQFPRPPHLGIEASPKYGNNFSSRALDRGGIGLDGPSRPVDAVQKMDPASHALRPNDDNRGRSDTNRTNPEFRGPTPGFDKLPFRSPGREYQGNSSRAFGGLSSLPHKADDVDGRDAHPFGGASRPFSLAPAGGHSVHESRFPVLPPGHMRRGDFDGPGNMRVGDSFRGGDVIGQDIPPTHFSRGELFGPRNLSGHPHLGEPGFATLHGHGHLAEMAGPGGFSHHRPFADSFGNKLGQPRLGEPGFRSSFPQGFPNDSGFFPELDIPRKRRLAATTGFCRICKLDCETAENLDMHSQTREHQKIAMDIVRGIKKRNAKKQKTSIDRSGREEGSKARNAGFQGRGSKP